MIRTWRKRYFSVDMKTKSLSYYGDEGKTVFKAMYLLNPSSTIESIGDLDDYKHVLSLKGQKDGKETVLLMVFSTLNPKPQTLNPKP